MSDTLDAWFCTHRDTVAIGDKRQHWEAYCRANRRCEVNDEGCHQILVTQEFLDTYNGEIAGEPVDG